MKYGLLTYQYPGRKGYRPKNVNIGDYIQSIAARQFLPSVDVFVDRDSVSSYSGDSIKLIMNGWWHIYGGNEVTSKTITPLYVAYHVTNPKGLTSKALDHLKQNAPIGCRDLATMNCLLPHGVEAYLSSCMTLTLGRTYYTPKEERTNTVYLVDCVFRDFEQPSQLEWYISRKARHASTSVSKKLRRRTWELVRSDLRDARIEKRTHIYSGKSLNDEERFQLADQFLRDYSKAKLVITSRLHCAIPVLSMGVPVLFVGWNLDDPRFAGALDWVNQIGFDQNHNYVERLPTLLKVDGFPSQAKEYADRLSQQCQQFVLSSALVQQ